jgi:hypothetical protein
MKRFIIAIIPVLFLTSCTGMPGTINTKWFTGYVLEKQIPDNKTAPVFSLSFKLIDGKEDMQVPIRELFYDGKSPEQYAGDLIRSWEKLYGDQAAQRAASDFSDPMNWEYSERHGLKSAGSFAVIDRSIEEFTGGAHPNHGTTIYVIDLNLLKQLSIEDIIEKESFANLYTLAGRELRLFSEEQTGESIAPREPLSKGIFFEDEIPSLKNFAPGPKGISFQWNPYEAAPYSAGTVRITIGWNELADLLTPKGGELAAAFKK